LRTDDPRCGLGTAFSQASMSSILVLALAVAAIGDDIAILAIGSGARRSLSAGPVHDLIGHGLREDHFVLRVDRDLDGVADANLRRGGHRPAGGIAQR
jgi:hypothetical protein